MYSLVDALMRSGEELRLNDLLAWVLGASPEATRALLAEWGVLGVNGSSLDILTRAGSSETGRPDLVFTGTAGDDHRPFYVALELKLSAGVTDAQATGYRSLFERRVEETKKLVVVAPRSSLESYSDEIACPPGVIPVAMSLQALFDTLGNSRAVIGVDRVARDLQSYYVDADVAQLEAIEDLEKCESARFYPVLAQLRDEVLEIGQRRLVCPRIDSNRVPVPEPFCGFWIKTSFETLEPDKRLAWVGFWSRAALRPARVVVVQLEDSSFVHRAIGDYESGEHAGKRELRLARDSEDRISASLILDTGLRTVVEDLAGDVERLEAPPGPESNLVT